MTRRHLESALMAGAFIEAGLMPCFRFSRIRFARYCFPPGYKTGTLDEDGLDSHTRKTLYGSRGDLTGNNSDAEVFDPQSTFTATCTCCPTPVREPEPMLSESIADGDCERPELPGGAACNLHTEMYLRKHPWRRLQDDYAIHSVQFSPDGQQLLAGSSNTSVRVIQISDGQQHVLPRPSKWSLGMPITTIRFMPPKADWAVGCNAHGEVFAFNPNCEGFETLFKEPQQTYTLDFSLDGLELATGGVDRKIRIYTLQPGSVVGLKTELRDKCPDSDFAHYSGSRITARRIEMINTEFMATEIPKDTRLHFPGGRPNEIVDITAKPYVMTRCYGTPDTLDPPYMPEPAAYKTDDRIAPPLREYLPTSPGFNITEGHSKRIMALRYHPERPNVLISAGWDNLVKLWDTRLQSGPVCQVYGPHVASPDALDINDHYLLTASWRARSSIEIWDMRTMNSNTGRAREVQLGYHPKSSKDERENVPPAELCPSIVQVEHNPLMKDFGPAEVIPISGPAWMHDRSKESGEYPYAARLLPSRAIVAAGSGFYEVRVVGRDTRLPIARIPMDSVVQSMDSILEGRYIGVGCSSGTVGLIGMA